LRNLSIVVLLALIELVTLGTLLLTLSGFLAVSLQIVTILALLFPVYAVWRQNLEKRRELVEGVRIWADHWDLMTRQFVEAGAPHPSQVTEDDVSSVRALADKTADQLAEALARGFRMFKISQPITDLISALRAFARNKDFSKNHGLFVQKISDLRPKTQSVIDAADLEYAKYGLRYGIPQKYFTILTSRIAGGIAALVLLILTLLWATVVLIRLLGG
jgi:hypothetical protein